MLIPCLFIFSLSSAGGEGDKREEGKKERKQILENDKHFQNIQSCQQG